MPAPAAAAAPAVTDPQIAAIVVAANDVDIAAGHLAVARAENAEVKAFGQQMVTDHSAVNKAATALVTKLQVKPEANPTSEQLTQDGAKHRQALQEKRGHAFDRAYIDNEVTYHQTVLDAIDQTLIPSAQNGELKALLEQTRPAIAAHLQRAQQIQASLKP
jgi:putative membrane protein